MSEVITTRTERLVSYILGPCTCDSAYKGRGLVSLQCPYCNNHDEAREALRLAYQLGHDECGTCASAGMVQGNRGVLSGLLNLMVHDGHTKKSL